MADNIIRRKDKATWGFTADDNGQIKLGVPTTGKDAEDILVKKEEEESRGNGGGFPDEDKVTYEYLSSLTKPKLLELATHHEIKLDDVKAKKEGILAELAEYYEVSAEDSPED